MDEYGIKQGFYPAFDMVKPDSGAHEQHCGSGMAYEPLQGYPELLTVEHLEEQIGLSKQTIRAMINDGRLPGFKLGKRLYVPKAKFVALVNGEL